jgi:hypothetical protein
MAECCVDVGLTMTMPSAESPDKVADWPLPGVLAPPVTCVWGRAARRRGLLPEAAILLSIGLALAACRSRLLMSYSAPGRCSAAGTFEAGGQPSIFVMSSTRRKEPAARTQALLSSAGLRQPKAGRR